MSDYQVEVLVRGRPVKVFKHKGDQFIEGRNGSSFELRLTNNTWHQVEMVASVDGLSVTDGEECGSESIGYIVPPKESVTIPGWKLPNNKAAEFVFEDKRNSYSNQVGKGTQNVGVIGFMVFAEKPPAPPTPPPTRSVRGGFPNPYQPTTPWKPFQPMWASNQTKGMSNSAETLELKGGTTRGMQDTTPLGATNNVMDSMQHSAVNISASCSPCDIIFESDEEGTDKFEIGTGWGDEIDHKVVVIEFERTDKYNPDTIITLFYDSKKGLISRGIEITKTKKRKNPKLPNAFPTYNNTGCTPPPGWK